MGPIIRTVRLAILLPGLLMSLWVAMSVRAAEETKVAADPLATLLEATPPLSRPLGNRPPLFTWSPELPANASDAQIETALRALQARGLSLFLRWQPNLSNTLTQVQRVAAIQKKLGMPVAVDATPISHGLFHKGDRGSHLDASGKPFRGSGLGWNPGCPFGAQPLNEEVRARFEGYAKAHQATGAVLDYWISDWELDGPNEWKQSWAMARKCVTCRTQIPDIDTNFAAYQAAVRSLRSGMQRENFVKPVQAQFPAVRIGNYAMNPHDGFRYYWDYYEEDAFGKPNLTEGIPYRREQGAYYRPWWRGEFGSSGYTLAAPVVYAWYHLFLNYSFTNTDYRWFYGMLLEGTSAGRSTPADTLLVPFLHGRPIGAPDKAAQRPPDFAELREATYKELVWHLLLRGADSFILWAPGDEAREMKPLHAVYAESLEYPDFFERGTPVAFDLPEQPGVVVSAMKWQDKLLVRRTDFAETAAQVTIKVEGKRIVVPVAAGKCQVLEME
ncbi:MAG: hypothetical protein ACOYOU_02010 [Kiritimatiellia bacterium]